MISRHQIDELRKNKFVVVQGANQSIPLNDLLDTLEALMDSSDKWLARNDELGRKIRELEKFVKGGMEAYQRGLKDGDACTSKSAEIAYQNGWNEAVERAVRVAELHDTVDPNMERASSYRRAVSEIVENVRTLKKGEA